MQKFVDRAGRIWIVDIDNTTLRRVKTLTGVHLLEAIDGDLITRLSTDPLLLGDVLFAICKPQADQQQITDEAFGEGLAGNSIDDATGALLEALINYFPESRRRLLRKAAEKQKLIETRGITTSFQAAGGTQPFIDLPAGRLWPNDSFTTRDKNEFDQARMAWIARWKPDLVIVSALWSTSLESDAEPLLEFLESHAGHVLLVEQPPELDLVDRRSVMQWLCYQGVRPRDGVHRYLPATNTEAYVRGRTALRNLAKRYRNVTVMPTYDLYAGGATGHEALVLDGKNVVYMDDDHLTDYGAQLAAPRFEAIFSDLVPVEPITP